MERRLAAILAADVVGYSRLMGADEAGTLATLKAHREDLIDPTFARHKGRVVKLMGDGALVEFASVTAAVECAVAIQEGMADRNADLPGGQRMDLRIGINLGDVIVEGDDLYGDGVNVAARLESQAEPGGICVSAIVRDQVAGKIPQSLEDMGEQALKNIEAPVRVYRVVRQRPPAAMPRGEEAGGKPSFDVSPARPPSIAILPFKNLSGNPDQDHIADGLRLGILSTLVQLPGLFLVGAGVMDGYRGKDLSAAQIGGELGVRYVLDGAVQLAGNRVRATLQLTDSEAQEIVWAERYDRVLDDLFEMQDEITQEVIISLDVKLLGREHDRDWFVRITGAKAREYFLRGISHLYSRSKADNAAARRMFESFYHAQPDLVFGPGVVALTHWLDAFNGWTDDPAGSKASAVEWARKAVEYDMNTGFGHVVLGHLLLFEGRHEEALANCREGAAIRTSCPLAHGVLASALTYCGDPQEAVASARRSLLIERVYPPWVVNVLATAYRDGEMLGLSIPAAEEAIRLDPKQTAPRLVLSSDYGLTKATDRARRAAAEVVEIEPAFRLSSYAASQPYKDPATLERLIEVLREAGLPD